MLNVNPPSDRLYRLMQGLLIDYAHKRVPEAAADRGVVDRQDALDAVVNLAAILDRNLQDGDLARGDATHMAAMLMVVRDYVHPLPRDRGDGSAGEADAVTDDLRELVGGLRAARRGTG